MHATADRKDIVDVEVDRNYQRRPPPILRRQHEIATGIPQQGHEVLRWKTRLADSTRSKYFNSLHIRPHYRRTAHKFSPSVQTPVSMTSTLIHQNPMIFPSPHEFRPERWLENPRLDRYLVSFSKGSRQCLGMNLAYTELYLCLACIFREYGLGDQKNPGGEMELFETTREDVEIQFDQFVAIPKADTKGVRVLIT